MKRGRAPSGQALAVPATPADAVDGPAGFDPSRVVDAFNKRLTIYRTKRDQANPFGEDCYNQQDATRYVVEAIELLAREAGLADVVHIEPEDLPVCQWCAGNGVLDCGSNRAINCPNCGSTPQADAQEGVSGND